MFENPTTPLRGAESFLQGFQSSSEASSRREQLRIHAEQVAAEQQKLQQQQAIMKIGQEAARTGDPRAISMYSALNPEGGKALRETVDYFVKDGTAQLQSIRDTKITDRPAVYKMKLAALRNNPYFDSSQYPDEYDPGLVDKMLEADIASGRDMSKSYELVNDESMRFDPSTGSMTPTGIDSLDAQKKRAEIKKLNKEIASDGVSAEDRFKNTTALRQDYLNNSKTFQSAKEGYERLEAAAVDPTPAGDLALIYGFMKVNDPGSTVREGEFAQAAQSGAFGDKIQNAVSRVVSGKRLTNEQRSDFLDRGKRLYKQAEKSQQKTVRQYTEIAKRNKLTPEDVVIDFNTTVPEAPQFQEGQTATNPKTGQKLTYKGGKWQ